MFEIAIKKESDILQGFGGYLLNSITCKLSNSLRRTPSKYETLATARNADACLLKFSVSLPECIIS